MMKCKIAHNEGLILVFLLLFIIGIKCSYLSSDFQSIQELCSSNRYIYTIKADELQQLKLTYNTTSGEINKWYQKSKRKCRKEFKTNNGASHFVIVISNMSIPSCSEKCHCNYFEIAEPGNTEKFCGEHKEAIYFESKSDYLSIDFQHGLSMGFEVSLEFTVVRNTYFITGLPEADPYLSGHFIETPYFPNTYQSDYTSEYVFHTDANNGHVMLLFLDFQIAPTSYIEIVGHNSTIPARFFGDIFRPPVFVSEKNELKLKFEANRQPGSAGFRAVSYFIKGSDLPFVKPHTNCGGSKYGYGGSLALKHQNSGFYDCLWHIVTPFLPQTKNFLTVANISLLNVGSKTSLEFREGHNSKSKLVKNIDCSNTNCSSITYEITVSAYNGLYVRFLGDLNSSSFVGMVYSTYHTGNCSSEQSNCEGRCLPPDLVCDGLMHCPDGSDELECTKTSTETLPPIVEKKFSSKASVAFNVILSLGICGILFVAVALFVIFYKGIKTVLPENDAEQPEVISEMTGPPPRANSTSSNLDYLPSYEDFIQASDRYPPLLYTRASKRNSEPYVSRSNLLHTTSFCNRVIIEPGTKQPSVDSNSHCVLIENMLADDPISVSPQPGCSYERSDFRPHKVSNRAKKRCGIKRAWSSDSSLDELNTSDCHVHLSITHCIYPNNCCQCSNSQMHYYSLPINFKIDSCDKDSGIDIVFPRNPVHQINVRSRHLSFCNNPKDCHPKILTIKTRCHSDPCQFSVHYSLH